MTTIEIIIPNWMILVFFILVFTKTGVDIWSIIVRRKLEKAKKTE